MLVRIKMRKIGFLIVLLFALSLYAAQEINIPLKMSLFSFAPMDGPTGSTPDPTDPNQFRATLSGNTLYIHTQAQAVSYVVIRSADSDKQDEDYFYGLSYGDLACQINRPGKYTIRIGYWDTDFYGAITVHSICLYDFNGHLIHSDAEELNYLPLGGYIIKLNTSHGNTSSKFIIKP